MTGPNCKHVKPGNYVTFPNDKGLKLSYVTAKGPGGKYVTIKDGTFLNEGRIFGVCSPEED